MPLDASPSPQGGALRADDPDLVRYRCLLAALRPEAVDPMEPLPREVVTCHAPTIRDPMASWGGTPKGYGASTREARGDVAGAAEVLAQVDLLPGVSPVVLRWLREHGDGHPRGADGRRLHGEGVTAASVRSIFRGACVDLALALADAGEEATETTRARPPGPWFVGLVLPREFGARKEAAYIRGRSLLWGAAGAWGK